MEKYLPTFMVPFYSFLAVHYFMLANVFEGTIFTVLACMMVMLTVYRIRYEHQRKARENFGVELTNAMFRNSLWEAESLPRCWVVVTQDDYDVIVYKNQAPVVQ